MSVQVMNRVHEVMNKINSNIGIKHRDAGYQGFGVVFNADLDGFPSPPRMSDAYCSRLLLSSSLLVTNGSFMAKAADTKSLVEFLDVSNFLSNFWRIFGKL